MRKSIVSNEELEILTSEPVIKERKIKQIIYESESDDEIEIKPPTEIKKKVLTEKQLNNLALSREKRRENILKRNEEKLKIKEIENNEIENKIIKKAVELKKKQIKKEIEIINKPVEEVIYKKPIVKEVIKEVKKEIIFI